MSLIINPPKPRAHQIWIAVVNYGLGNRVKIANALQYIGVKAIISDSPEQLSAADGLILPGVGAFPRGMANLNKLGLDAFLLEVVPQGMPTLGICLGMHLAFDYSDEQRNTRGLGLIPGRVSKLEPMDPMEQRLPHIGWNQVYFCERSPLEPTTPNEHYFYHAHSYAPVPTNLDDIVATGYHGGPFVSAVTRGSFYGVQFHPESSSANGLKLLNRFAHLCTTN